MNPYTICLSLFCSVFKVLRHFKSNLYIMPEKQANVKTFSTIS